MKNRTSGYNSDNEQSSSTTKTTTTTTATAKQLQQDLSILRKPILTSLIGFLEAKRAYDNGTEEIRRLLSQECDILYECKVCRNLFRSLTNFISHKRVYCQDCYNNGYDTNRNGFIDHDLTTIIQAEEKYIQKCNQSNNNHKSSNKRNYNISSSIVYNNNNNNQQTSNNNNNNNNNNNSNNNNNNNIEKPNKDLTSIIERLTNREQKNRTLKLADFYEQISLKLTQDEVIKKNHIIQLDGIPNSNAAVYQTIKNEDCDNIKKEIIEVNDMLNCKNILGPDGKLLNMNSFSVNGCKNNNDNDDHDDNDDDNNNNNNNNKNNNNIQSTINSTINDIKIANGIENNLLEKNLACKICNMKFSTEKTLKLHIQTKHILSTYVYQCPSCSQTFLQPSAVIRHLSNDHKKSLRRIRQMRETIFKKRMRIDEVQIKGPSRELARLQANQAELTDAENTRAWMDNIERSPKNSPLCTYCGKKFERRAVLTTHLQNCSAKNRQTPTPIINKKLTDLTTFSRETSASRSSTSSPANINNSVSTINGTNNNSNSNSNTNTSSLLAFAAKSIANGFEPIKAEETKTTMDYCPSNEIFEIIKPKSDKCLNQKINKRKRRKPETIIIRKTEINNVNSIQETTPKIETTNQNDVGTQVERNMSTEKKVEKLRLTKLSLKNVIKKQKLNSNPNKIIKEIETNEDGGGKDIPIPTTIENCVKPIKTSDKLLNVSCNTTSILKKKDFNRDKFLKLVTPRKDLIFYCRICKKAFGALSNLRRHISMFHYRRRKFGCHICPYRAFRKYDVVNHLNSAHSLTGEQNLDQILVAEDNYGKDAVDGDIIISDNGEIKGEKEEDIENIKADIAKANAVKNKIHLNKTENYIIKNVTNKKGRKPKEPYVVKNIPIQNTDDIINLDLEIVPNIDETTNVEKINLELANNLNESSLVTIQDDKTNDTTSNDLEIICDEKILNKNNVEQEENIVEQKQPGNIKRSDSILSISSNEDRINSTTTSTNSSTTNGPTLKRPIRNRVKPVNKDFVYDLSTFLKKDMLCTERDSFNFGNKIAAKRRNTIVNLDDSSRESNSSNSTISSNSSYNLQIIPSNNQNLKDDEKIKQLSKSTSTQSTPMVFSHNSILENSNKNNNNCKSRSTGTSTINTKPIILSPKLITPQYKKETNTMSTPSSPTEIISHNKILNGIDKIPTLNSSINTNSNHHHLFKSFEDLKKVKHVRRTSDDAIIRFYNKKRKSIDISDLNSSLSDTSIQSVIGNTNISNCSNNNNNKVNNITKLEKTIINGSATDNFKIEDKKSLVNSNKPITGMTTSGQLIKNDLGTVVEHNKNMPIKDIRPILLANKKIGTEPQQLQHHKTEEKFTIKCPSEKDFEEYLLKNNLSEPVKKINISAIIEQQENANATKNLDSISNQQNALLVSGKRISMLQRLAENKNKKLQESLLRNALEN